MSRFVSAVVALLLTLTFPRAAHAQADVAAALKKQGDAQFDESKFAEALQLYEKAYAAYADPALLYNQARALEAMGDYPEALDKLEKFKAIAPAALVAKVGGLDALMAQLRPRVATLTVQCNVPGALLVVRNRQLGTMGREWTIAARAGTADIEVRADGYEPARRTVDLPGGGSIVVKMELHSTRGVVAVVTRPAGSEVVIDEKPVGLSPLETRVAPGPHVIVLRRAGYDEQRFPVTVAADERRNIDVQLEERRSIFGRWYFWAGAAVVVAGAAVTAALLIEAPAEKGSFNPDQARAPLTVSF